MAQDVYVKEAYALRDFAMELRQVGSNMEGHCLQLSGAIFMEENVMRSGIDRIESALREAGEEVERARREYDDYTYDTDRDAYSEYEARSLLECLRDAETRYAEVERDYDEGKQLLQEASYVMTELEARTKNFMTRIGQLTDEAGDRVERATYDIYQYQNIR